METWDRPAHRRGGRNNPSFSSSLLDSIYRSIDETDGGGAKREQRTGGAPEHYLFPPLPTVTMKRQSTVADGRSTAAASNIEKPVNRRKHEKSDHHHRHRFFTSTSSSSDGSSYGGFSSSDAESARPKPIRTAPPPVRSERIRTDLPPPPPTHQQEKKSGSIRSRFRDLRKARGSAPASPGARLAGFLNALFSGAGSPKKAKVAAPVAASGGDESACSSASSYTRSCLIKTPPSGGRSSGGKRTVRFGPVSVVVGEDCRPCDRRPLYDDGGDPAVARAKESRRMVEELLRGLEEEEEDDDDGQESDSSSDLFELENLTAIGGGYRDELPVYGTTHLVTNRAVAHALVM